MCVSGGTGMTYRYVSDTHQCIDDETDLVFTHLKTNRAQLSQYKLSKGEFDFILFYGYENYSEQEVRYDLMLPDSESYTLAGSLFARNAFVNELGKIFSCFAKRKADMWPSLLNRPVKMTVEFVNVDKFKTYF
jgi:hypothetical protein